MFSKKSLYSWLMLSCATLAMEEEPAPETTVFPIKNITHIIDNATNEVVSFKSPKHMFQYANLLETLLDQENFAHLLIASHKSIDFSDEFPKNDQGRCLVSASDMELVQFNRAHAFAMTYLHYADQSLIKKECLDKLLRAYNILNSYIQDWQFFPAKTIHVNVKERVESDLILAKIKMTQLFRKIFINVGLDKADFDMDKFVSDYLIYCEEISNFLIVSDTHYSKNIEHQTSVIQICKNLKLYPFFEKQETNKNINKMIKKLETYFARADKNNPRNKEILDILKNSQEIVENNKRLLEIKNKPKKNKKIENKYLQSIKKIKQEGFNLSQKYLGEAQLEYSQKLQLSLNALSLLADSNYEEGTNLIDNLEHLVKNRLSLSDVVDDKLSYEEIAKVYQSLVDYTDFRSVNNNIFKIISFYVKHNKLDLGLMHLEALDSLTPNDLSEKIINRYIQAILKNALGDPTELAIFEEEFAIKLSAQQKKLQQQKALIQKKKVAAIKEKIAAEQTEQEVASMQQLSLTDKTKKTAIGQLISEQEPIVFVSEEISLTKEKLKKEARHQQALTEKAKLSKSGKGEIEDSEVKVLENSISNLSLPSISVETDFAEELAKVNLKGTNKKVLQEIINNSWTFTRNQFTHFCQALGCTTKSGNGIHLKVDLPKSVHISYQGTLVTILSNTGGALTLPSWDGSDVPQYMRKQITLGLEKIAVLIKAAKK